MSDDLRARALRALCEDGDNCKCLTGLKAGMNCAYAHSRLPRVESALRAAVAQEREVAKIADFLIEEIIDREGREGMSDYHFTEQVIQLAQDCKDRIAAIRARGDES